MNGMSRPITVVASIVALSLVVAAIIGGCAQSAQMGKARPPAAAGAPVPARTDSSDGVMLPKEKEEVWVIAKPEQQKEQQIPYKDVLRYPENWSDLAGQQNA